MLFECAICAALMALGIVGLVGVLAVLPIDWCRVVLGREGGAQRRYRIGSRGEVGCET
jgi:hypothetical protein